MNTGKARRLARIFRRGESGGTPRGVIIPLDHGVSSGVLPGLSDMPATLAAIAAGGADAVVGHRGLFRWLSETPAAPCAALLHLSSGTSLSPFPNRKTLTASAEDALRLGADGISIHVNIGDPDEAAMLADFGRAAKAAADWGLPLLAMLYARGPAIKNSFDPAVLAHCARIGAELGADAVKVPYSGDAESFSRVVEGCGVPLLVAGGPPCASLEDFFHMIAAALSAGAAGVSIGRNVFQHRRPDLIVAALRALVHEGQTPGQALRLVAETNL